MTNMVKCFTVRQAQPKFSWHPSEITCIKCHLMESDSDMKCMRALWWAEPLFWSIRRLCLLPPAPQPPHCWTDPANHPPLQAQPITSTAGKMKMRKGAVEGSRSYTSNTFFFTIYLEFLLCFHDHISLIGRECNAMTVTIGFTTCGGSGVMSATSLRWHRVPSFILSWLELKSEPLLTSSERKSERLIND